jgi:hypothetical protein
MTKWKAVGLLALLVPALAAAGPEGGKPAERKVSVRLSFSVEEYDPSKPSQAVMKCVVHNDSYRPIHVPVGFDGGYVRVQSGFLTLSKNKRAKEDVQLAWVEPGQQQVVFELPLDDILLRTGERDAAWHWGWPRRPEPPRSPIHQYRQPGFVAQATFSVSLDVGGSTLTSEDATLKVKPGDADK